MGVKQTTHKNRDVNSKKTNSNLSINMYRWVFICFPSSVLSSDNPQEAMLLQNNPPRVREDHVLLPKKSCHHQDTFGIPKKQTQTVQSHTILFGNAVIGFQHIFFSTDLPLKHWLNMVTPVLHWKAYVFFHFKWSQIWPLIKVDWETKQLGEILTVSLAHTDCL